ncbi:uncharacterized protein [Enoplosus armatus]|uniref:uncharacterized protein n=1 Tax=Enoplosus armatus TaxID=215367 RepID=UPI00399339AD
MMLNWIHSNNMEAETDERNMSKAEILRGIIAEKLTTAAQEILAVVERTVAGYEEEAAGFRQEIDRQRRQLELLLQPEIKLETPAESPEQTAPPSASSQHRPPPNIFTSNPCSLPGPTSPFASQFSSYNTRSSNSVPLTTSHHPRTPLPSTSNTHATSDQIQPTTNLTTTTAVLTHSSSSTQHTPPAAAAPSTPKIFKEICSILPLSSGGKKRRCKITVEELARRVGPPEYMSFSSLAAYLRTDNNARRELQAQLEDAGIKPSQLTAETSLFSRLCEEEVDALCESLAGLVRDHLPFHGLHVIPEAEDEEVTLERLSDFWSHLRRATAAIKDRVEAVDLASHAVMLSWSHSDSMEAVDGPRNVSKAELLRGVVAEKLTTAAQEILAVVERTVAGYEEEAAGLRQEIDRQRRQLELLVQPEIKLETTDDQFPVCEPAAGGGGGGGELPEEEEQHKYEPSVEDSGGLGLICYTEVQMEDNEEEDQEHLTEPDSEAASRLRTPTVQSDRRSAGRPRISEPQDHIDLRIRFLEDSQIKVLSARVFRKYPVQEVRCPRGLQEEDFLDLLRSAFPQLAAQKQFDFFTSDRTKRLQPLRLETLTPEEIYRTAGHSALYIRLKLPEEVQAREEESLQRTDEAAAADPPSTDQTRLNTRVQSDRRKPGRPRMSEPQTHVDLRIRVLEDSQIDVLSANVFKKYPVQEVRCPRGLQEEDFLDLLRSAFPQLAAQKQFDFFTSDRTKRLQPLRLETLTPEEIYRTAGHSALYIRLKKQEEDLQDSSSTSDQTRLKTSSPVLSSSSTSQHEADGERPESAGLWSLPVLSESEDEASHDDWKPDKREKHQRESETERMTRKRRVKRSAVRMIRSDDSDSPLSCKVCRALRGSTSMLIKHAWSHVDDPERLCGVCGEHLESADELRSHLQSHQKTHSCNICGKSFLSITGLNGHVARHKGKKPYECKICHKAFAQKSVLRNHKWVHAADKPHKCEFCQKSCVSKFDLTRHRLTHTGVKPHRCNMCGKSLSSLETFSQHMLSHSGHKVKETLAACEICSKTFGTKQRLQVHMRNHSRERPFVCSKCSKRFMHKSNLVTHMRVHTGEKPYKCSVCSLAFSQSHCVKRHMKTHQDCRTAAPVQILSKRLMDAINGAKSVVKRVR